MKVLKSIIKLIVTIFGCIVYAIYFMMIAILSVITPLLDRLYDWSDTSKKTDTKVECEVVGVGGDDVR